MQKKKYKKIVQTKNRDIEKITQELDKTYPNFLVVDEMIQDGLNYVAMREEQIKVEIKALHEFGEKKEKIIRDFFIFIAIYVGVFGIVLGQFGLLFNWLLSSKIPVIVSLVSAIILSIRCTCRVISHDYPYLSTYFKARKKHESQESLIAERLNLQTLERNLLKKKTIVKWKKRSVATEDKTLSNKLKMTRNDANFQLEFYENEHDTIMRSLPVLECAKVEYYVEMLYNALEAFNSANDITEKRMIAKDINEYIKILLDEYKGIENPEYQMARRKEKLQ